MNERGAVVTVRGAMKQILARDNEGILGNKIIEKILSNEMTVDSALYIVSGNRGRAGGPIEKLSDMLGLVSDYLAADHLKAPNNECIKMIEAAKTIIEDDHSISHRLIDAFAAGSIDIYELLGALSGCEYEDDGPLRQIWCEADTIIGFMSLEQRDNITDEERRRLISLDPMIAGVA